MVAGVLDAPRGGRGAHLDLVARELGEGREAVGRVDALGAEASFAPMK